MSTKSPVICLSFTQWDTPYVKSTFKLMEALAAHRPVLIVDYPYTWKDMVEAVAGKKKYIPWKRHMGLEGRIRKINLPEGELQVLSLPPVLPVNYLPEGNLYHGMINWESRKLAHTIRQAMKKLGWQDPLVFNAFQPVFGLPLAGKLNEISRIYYAYDEIGAANWAGKHGKPAEEAYLKCAEAVVTSSSGLQKKFSFRHPVVEWIPNGVDPTFFEPALAPTATEGPFHAGFVGSIDDRMDMDLLAKVMTSLPDWTFHFIGRVVDSALGEQLSNYPNARLYGPKPAAELPELLKQFQVGLLPYVRNSFTEGIYPMKLHEYFAAGLPVAATAFGDMPLFHEQVMLSNDAEAWVNGLNLLAKEDSETLRISRRAFATSHTWPHRAAQLDQLMCRLEQKEPASTRQNTVKLM